MATRISAATGNWLTAGTWGLVDATSLLNSTAGTTTITASYTQSAAFTPGAIEIDGIALRFSEVALTDAAKTFYVSLYNSTDSTDVAGTTVTVLGSDLQVGASRTVGEGSWEFFKFAAPVTLEAAHNYKVQVKASAASGTYLYRDATLLNWSRMLRTTTTGAPAASDDVYVMGELTGAGTGNDILVWMNQVAAAITKYGSVYSNHRGTLKVGDSVTGFAAAATAYYLQLDGNYVQYVGGSTYFGEVAHPIPRDSSFVLEFDCDSDLEWGLRAYGGTFVGQGLSRTVGKNIVQCLLNTDEDVGQTVLGVNADTGWLDNDWFVLAPTSRTATEYELCQLSGNAAAAALTIDTPASLAYAHSGNAAGGPAGESTQAEAILLTRNVTIRSDSATNQTYAAFCYATQVDLDWVEFQYVNGDAYTGRVGKSGCSFHPGPASVGTAVGAVTVDYCSVRGGKTYCLFLAPVTPATLTVSNTVVYHPAGTSGGIFVSLGASVTMPLTNVTVIGGVNGIYAYSLSGTMTLSGVTVAGCGGSGAGAIRAYVGTADSRINSTNLVVHSNVGYGISIEGSQVCTFTTSRFWRNSGNALTLIGLGELTFTNVNLFGNGGTGCNIYAGHRAPVLLTNVVSNAEAAYTTAVGVAGVVNGTGPHIIENSTFGASVAHGTAGISFSADISCRIILRNTTLTNAVEVTGTALGALDDQQTYGVFATKHDKTSGEERAWLRFGTQLNDKTAGLYRTASPSQRLTPSSATGKLKSSTFRVKCASGATPTISVYARESVVGDGTDYNGTRARLICRRNVCGGPSSDTVIATATVASEGAWELLTGVCAATTEACELEFYIDCDGTTGWVNVDDWSVSGQGTVSLGNYSSWYADKIDQYLAASGGGHPVIGSPIVRRAA
jgi:hypothetical protein